MPSTAQALIVIDMLNPYDHPEAEQLACHVAEALPAVCRLLETARGGGVPVVYVNDNYGDWNSSSEELSENAMAGRHPDLVEPVLPRRGDSFVIKARHSAFYETPLEYLLGSMEVDELVLAGQVTEQCVFYSALDAHVRHFETRIPTDAVAAIDGELAGAALKMMERNLGATLCPAAEALRRDRSGSLRASSG
jgi:nicotinamidase-related amidase